jgi:hypothetical protein
MLGQDLVPIDHPDYGPTHGIPYSSRREYAEECRKMVAAEFNGSIPFAWRGMLELMIYTTPLPKADGKRVLVNLHAGEVMREYLRKSSRLHR